jgi:hypothetical protein
LVHKLQIKPLEPAMTTTRPSSFLMTTFVLAAAVLVTVAVSPILQIAASVVA